jgi:hypothetical protein
MERPEKTETARTHLTVGSNLIVYPGDTHAPTANITAMKLHINSTLSTPGAKMVCTDVKTNHLNTPMEKSEYMRILLNMTPQEIIEEYKLIPIAHKDFV